jgi:hypothetical protein
MKLTFLSLLAGGVWLMAMPALAADMTTTAPSAMPSTGVGSTGTMQLNPGLPPATPEESTGQPLGALPEQSTTVPGGLTQFGPSGTAPESPSTPGQPSSTSTGGE